MCRKCLRRRGDVDGWLCHGAAKPCRLRWSGILLNFVGELEIGEMAHRISKNRPPGIAISNAAACKFLCRFKNPLMLLELLLSAQNTIELEALKSTS
jgi:hypothetical protein